MLFRIFSVALALTISSVFAQDSLPRHQTAQAFEVSFSKTVPLKYLLFKPAGYESDKSKKWPLMLFLHGAGERGTNLSAVAVHGPPKLVKDRPDFPFVVVSPQCANGEWWQKEALLALVDDVIAKHNIDPDRVYLTGLSMGGFGTWSLAVAYPERFAAIAPICGGGEMVGVLLTSGKRAEALKNMPVWAFHGAKDGVVKLAESERMVNAFKQIGNAGVKLTVYPEAGHDSWTETYQNEELYTWMLQQSRPQEKKK